MSDEKALEEFATTYKETNPDATDEDIKALWDAKQTADMNLTEKVIKVMDDYGDMLTNQIEVKLLARMDEVVKEVQDELVSAIRKGVGLDDDPVIHLSEVQGLVRKMLLEKDSGKKTADDDGAGPEPKPADDVRKFDMDKRFSELTKGRSVV